MDRVDGESETERSKGDREGRIEPDGEASMKTYSYLRLYLLIIIAIPSVIVVRFCP